MPIPGNIIDWVEIPGATAIIGLTAAQKAAIREKLWEDYGVNQFDAAKRQAVLSLAQQYRHNVSLTALTPTALEVLPDDNDPRMMYFKAERHLERVPDASTVSFPTFYIARFPLTREQCDLFFESNYARNLGWSRSVNRTEDLPTMPEEVTWEEADAIAHWFGGSLPSKVQWERVARGVKHFYYPWGNEWDPTRGNFNGSYRPAYSRDKGIWRTAVDSYPGGVSPEGVWDLAGNMPEWLGEYHANKGWSFKGTPLPMWFWSISALKGEGTHGGIRPILAEHRRQSWNGAYFLSAGKED